MSIYKGWALLWADLINYPLTLEDDAFLHDKDFQKMQANAKNNKNNDDTLRISLINNVKKTFPMLAAIHGKSFVIDEHDPGWLQFPEAVAVRNGIVHPKSLASLTLTPGQYVSIVKVQGWWENNTTILMRSLGEATDQYIRQQRQPRSS